MRCNRLDSDPNSSFTTPSAVYAVCGYTRRKKKEMKTSPNVPDARSIKKSPTSPGAKTVEIEEKKNAERPKAASGNAVAVPRWCGQFNAAE